jgi:Galactose-3-O-sulfotransferase
MQPRTTDEGDEHQQRSTHLDSVLEGAFLGRRSERSMEQKRRRRSRRRRTEPLLLAVFVGTALLLINQLHFATTHPGLFTSPSSTAANGDYEPSSSALSPSKVVAWAAKNRTAAAAISPQKHDSLIRPRAFTAWDRARYELPCEPLEDYWQTARVQMSPASTGLMLVKTFKTGSSTAAGVTLRLAQQIARKRNLTLEVADRNHLPPRQKASWTLCKNRVMHAPTHTMGYDRRDKSKSFLWSIVREPTSRTVSHYFHSLVSRRRINASDDAFFIRYLKSEIPSYQLDFEDYQIKYLSFHHLPRYNRSTYDPIHEINDILRNYDFVAVTERLDESLVAMQMLLGLDAEDIAHVEYVPPGAAKKRCLGGELDPVFSRRFLTIIPPFAFASIVPKRAAGTTTARAGEGARSSKRASCRPLSARTCREKSGRATSDLTRCCTTPSTLPWI